MEYLTISDWIGLFAALMTAAGVIVVFVQLQKLGQQIKLQSFADYTKRYQEIVLRFPEDINSSDFVLVGRSDYEVVMRNMRAYLDLSFEEWFLNRSELLDFKIWELWSGGILTALSKSAFQQAWGIVRKDTKFGSEFEAFIDDCMNGRSAAQQIHPSLLTSLSA